MFGLVWGFLGLIYYRVALPVMVPLAHDPLNVLGCFLMAVVLGASGSWAFLFSAQQYDSKFGRQAMMSDAPPVWPTYLKIALPSALACIVLQWFIVVGFGGKSGADLRYFLDRQPVELATFFLLPPIVRMIADLVLIRLVSRS